MRILAAGLVVAHAVAVALAFLFALFAATGPFENVTGELQRDYNAVAALLAGAAVLAAVTAIAVVLRRTWWAAGAFVAQLAFGVGALDIALSRSDHSDGRLLLFAVGVEAAGFAAVALSARAAGAGAPAL